MGESRLVDIMHLIDDIPIVFQHVDSDDIGVLLRKRLRRDKAKYSFIK